MKVTIYIVVEVYGLIINDVHVFFTEKEAEDWWGEYTHVPWEEYKKRYLEGDEEWDAVVREDYDQTKIFVKEVVIPKEVK